MSTDDQTKFYDDAQIAMQTALFVSAPDRRLAGAEWLHQIATRILDAAKKESEEVAP